MSRGFVKEEDQEEAPFIPPRAALPTGTTNYVTPLGYRILLKEREDLEKQRKGVGLEEDKESRLSKAVIEGKLHLLNQRISSARIIENRKQNRIEVRFGALVKFRFLDDKKIQEFQIVGVDEADIAQQKISFLSPLAVVLSGKKEKDVVSFTIGGKGRKIEIIKITY